MIRGESLQIASILAYALALAPLLLALAARLTGKGMGLRWLGSLAGAIDALNRHVGQAAMWLALAMVLLQAVIVIMRYAFGVGRVFLQEGMLYLHGILFLNAAGYTLLRDAHVRVDIFYRGASPRRKALIDLLGTYLFLFPVTILLFGIAFPYVRQSWRILEHSREAGGIPAVWALKAFLLVFCLLLFLQGISLAITSVLRLSGMTVDRPGAKLK